MISLVLLAAAAQSSWVLTPEGLGPVRIGMTRAQVARVLKTPLRGAAIESDDICVEKDARGLPGVAFMFEDKRLTRVSVFKPSKIRTGTGIRVGSTDAQVKRAYGARLATEKSRYMLPPARLLIRWTAPNEQGLAFETGEDRRVYTMRGGKKSITYAEGCA